MGGDHGCGVVIEGVKRALEETPSISTLFLVGKREEIHAALPPGGFRDHRVRVVHASEVLTMEDKPVAAVRRKRDASIVRAMELVSEGKADGVLSLGNTGGIFAAATFKLGRIPGVDRGGIATLIPTPHHHFVLMDAGANIECKPIHLAQFAVMGDAYARAVRQIAAPRVGLLSNGLEAAKGNALVRAAALDALWAANGDQLSRIYTGSDAIKSSYGRLGRLTLSSFVADIKNNARRFYMNNFTEKARQEAIDVFLGRAESCEALSLGSTRSLPEECGCAPGAAPAPGEAPAERGPSSTGSRPEPLVVMALTWNTGGVQPDALREYDVLVSAGRGTPVPHIFVASLQEIVELSASQIVNVDPEQRIRWEAALQAALQRHYGRQTQYSLIVSHQLVGTTIGVFVQSALLPGVRSVSIASKKTGMGGMAGNKGSVSIRFDFFDAALCFVSSHFTAGQGAAADRDRDAQSVLSELAFPYGRSILSHDVVVWAGDMNYRLDLDREAAHARIVAREFASLHASDQLAARLGVIGSPFWGFGEGALRFAPTYKYDPGTNIYDTSEKARVPSWTDRVLFRGGERLGVRAVYYDRAEIDVSDHKPVKCVLEVTRLPQ